MIGDFNGDGKPDLATANRDESTISVLLGNGDGTFRPRTDYATASQPFSFAIGDLNGDGTQDLATTHYGSNTVSVLLGNGDGTFGARRDYGTGRPPVSLGIADFDGDGKPDVGTASSWSTVSVLLGNGDGTFGTNTQHETGIWPNSMAIGDLNGDGMPDVVTANDSRTVSVLLNIVQRPVPMGLTLPRTLNLRSMGRWVSAHLQPTRGLDASMIDISSIRFQGNVPAAQAVGVDPTAPTAIGDHNGDGVTDLMVRFDRRAVELTLTQGAAVAVTVTGAVAGTPFRGTSTLTVLRTPGTQPRAGSGPDAVMATTVEGTPVKFALHLVGPNPGHGVLHVDFSLSSGGQRSWRFGTCWGVASWNVRSAVSVRVNIWSSCGAT